MDSSSTFIPNLLINPRLNFAKFRTAVLTEARLTCTAQTDGITGLLGFIVAPAVWAAMPSNINEDRSIKPVFSIELAAQPAPTATKVAFLGWERTYAKQQLVIAALNLFTAKFNRSIPATDISALSDPFFGMQRPIDETFAYITARYNTLTTADFALVDDSLRKPRAGEDIACYIETHRDMHSIRATAGQPINSIDQCRYLTDGLLSDPACANAIASYRQATPRVQDQTFALLAAHILLHAPNYITTTSDIGLASPVFSVQLQQQRKPVAPAPLTRSTTTAVPNNNSKDSYVIRYCYHHGFGINGHVGTQCKHMLQHKFSADKLNATGPNPPNPAGGSTKQPVFN
jgi:hypothetical protein